MLVFFTDSCGPISAVGLGCTSVRRLVNTALNETATNNSMNSFASFNGSNPQVQKRSTVAHEEEGEANYNIPPTLRRAERSYPGPLSAAYCECHRNICQSHTSTQPISNTGL